MKQERSKHVPLWKFVQDFLRERDDKVSIGEIMAGVKEAGYITTSDNANFRVAMYQCLTAHDDLFCQPKKGFWQLKDSVLGRHRIISLLQGLLPSLSDDTLLAIHTLMLNELVPKTIGRTTKNSD